MSATSLRLRPERLERPRTTSLFCVVREGGGVEYFWVRPFTKSGRGFRGRLNKTPRMVRSVKLHSTISFARREIVDWTYLQDGRMQGNFTACAILRSEPPGGGPNS